MSSNKGHQDVHFQFVHKLAKAKDSSVVQPLKPLVCVKHSVKHCSHDGFTNKTLNSGMYKK